jgi:hypothetical protein
MINNSENHLHEESKNKLNVQSSRVFGRDITNLEIIQINNNLIPIVKILFFK